MSYIYIQASLAIKLPRGIPEAPDDQNEYDAWYEKYIEPTMKKFYDNPICEDIDVHDEEIDIGD